MAKPTFTIFGLPGSGKSVQAKAIEESFNLKYISIGSLARKAAKNDKEIEKKVTGGEILSAKTVAGLITSELEQTGVKNGVVFDNFPFNKKQLSIFQKEIRPKFNLEELIGIYLDITPETALKRISSRKVCPKCSKAFKPGDKGYKKGICPTCKEKLVIREDDRPKIVKLRIEKYQKQVVFLTKYFKKVDRLIKINGQQSIDEIKQTIKDKLSKKHLNLIDEQ